MEKIIYGVAYYYEYLPYDRLQEDIKMMKEAGINTVRIAESTWSTYEKSPGIFDFSTVEYVLDEMEKAGIDVIIGTPTYAVPNWLVELDPDVMVYRKGTGRALYGPRQSMDITNRTYLYYAERVIRKLMEVTAHRKHVIGFQIDNETKAYGTSSKNVQNDFRAYLKEKFNHDLSKLNHEFGLDYWSNRIDSWEQLPDVNGTINGSYGAEFEKFQRLLVDRFLQWQADIVAEYTQDDQFITQNFDFEWRGYSYGVQPDVNHFKAAKAITVAGCDIYHPTQDELTGMEIAFGGDSTRNLKKDNYLVLETQAQGFPAWTPFKNQLRLQAYSHLSSGANAVMYWHWHSIHNSAESYWKGLLSHDFRENDTYYESKKIGQELKALSPKLVNLKKSNRVALLVSNEALTGLKWFPIDMNAAFQSTLTYNDVVRHYYTALYQLNIEVDIVSPDHDGWSDYEILVVPALYAAPDSVYEELGRFVSRGGKLLASFKTAITNEHLKISYGGTPKNLEKVFGMTYNQFTIPTGQVLDGEIFEAAVPVRGFMEYLKPDTAKSLATYGYSQTQSASAITLNSYDYGQAVYIACMLDQMDLNHVLEWIFEKEFSYELSPYRFPIVVKKGQNDAGNTITYILNYSNQEKVVASPISGQALLEADLVQEGQILKLEPWGLEIIETTK
ncbi:beta-galactosidase [Streptococcus rupicaprae]|uniref:beta-galactosidase n=1 Tax=Streptococcus rupicaprae TaxID=759619 RepID=A0ABV2FIT4_9STRE